MSDPVEPPQDPPPQDDGRSAAAPGGGAAEPGSAPTPAPDRDSPGKEALDRWLEPFAALLFPRLHALVDWSRGWEALDAELQAVVRDAELGGPGGPWGVAGRVPRAVLCVGLGLGRCCARDMATRTPKAPPERQAARGSALPRVAP